MSDRLLEAWLLATVILAGIAAGSIGLVLVGRLLGRQWVTPVDDELIPAGMTLPLVALMMVPVLLALPALYDWAEQGAEAPLSVRWWFDPLPFIIRSTLYLLLWTAIAAMLFRGEPRRDMAFSVIALALLLPSAGLAGMDWVLAREPYWWSSLFGFAFALSQLTPALALALIANVVQQEHLERVHDRSLRSALLTFALATLGLWFVQFLTAWMGNLPQAAGWYEARLVGGRGLLIAGAAAALILAILLLVIFGSRRRAMLGASILLVVQYLLHMAWLLRPWPRPVPGITDLLVVGLLAAVWFAAWLWLMRRQDRVAVQSGLSGSS